MGKRPYTVEEDKLILMLRKDKVVIDQICEQLNRSKPSVSYRIYRILDKLESNEKSKILEVKKEKIVEIQGESKTEEIEVNKAPFEEEEEDNRQYYFKEIYLPPTELDKLSLNVSKQTEEELEYLERFNRLKGRLISRVFELIEIHMTEHQKKIVVLMLKNKTYNNMAILLNINYTAVAHAIKGIKTKRHGKYHGGIERKLRKICMKDQQCVDILTKMRQARQELHQQLEENSEVLVEGY